MNSFFNIGVLLFLTITIVYIQGGLVNLKRDLSGSNSESYQKGKCGKDEEYKQCGSACPSSCSDLFYPQLSKFCITLCVSGCFCKSGLYRSKDGKCVKPDKCCQGKNEQYLKCGTACPETCHYKPKICTLQCVSGCFCKPDFIRKDNSTKSPCIKKDQC